MNPQAVVPLDPARPLPQQLGYAKATSIQPGREGIREHMEVIGADGGHVGTVDKVEGDRIKLTKKDDPDGSG